VIFKEANGIGFMQFPDLLSFPDLFHAVFTRHGGCSVSPFNTLNMTGGLGDDPRHVARNRERISECAGGGEPIFINQVHGTRIWILKKDSPGSGDREISEADSVITDIPGKILVVQVADCQPSFVYDPVRRVAANIHAGWRGSIGGIVEKTVHAMTADFGSQPGDMLACIGPSLGPCCAEFIHYRKEIPALFWGYKEDNNRFDFWSMSRDQLTAAGVPAHRIHLAKMCTRCRRDLFYSYRRDNVTGRFAAVIGLRG